jgi:hypothetical protein
VAINFPHRPFRIGHNGVPGKIRILRTGWGNSQFIEEKRGAINYTSEHILNGPRGEGKLKDLILFIENRDSMVRAIVTVAILERISPDCYERDAETCREDRERMD